MQTSAVEADIQQQGPLISKRLDILISSKPGAKGALCPSAMMLPQHVACSHKTAALGL